MEDDFGESFDSRSVLVAQLKEHSVVLNKSMLPKCVKEKELAWEKIKAGFLKNTGKFVTLDQLKKILQNMKSAVKKKTDLNATGNRPMKLLTWEREFLDLLNSDESPVFQKVPGAVAVGVGLTNKPNVNSTIGEDVNDSQEANGSCLKRGFSSNRNENIEKKKKMRIPSETEETAKFTTSELQRWLILEQIKLTQLQVKREELLLERQLQVNNGLNNNQQLIELEGDQQDLTEFLVIKNTNF